jgi:hypothetical protein
MVAFEGETQQHHAALQDVRDIVEKRLAQSLHAGEKLDGAEQTAV